MRFALQNRSIVPREKVVIDMEDRGYYFGDGVYEVVRIYEGKFFLAGEHLKRLKRSAGELQIPFKRDEADLLEQLKELVEKEAVTTGIIYIQVTRGIHSRVLGFPPPEHPVECTAYVREMLRPEAELQTGVRAILVSDIRWLRCDIKCLNLIPNLLAQQKALDRGTAEAIQHRDDIITEGAFTNVFQVTNGVVQTHPLDHLVLPGVTRAHVLSLCSVTGIPIREEASSIKALLGAEEVFVTSTTKEILPVVQVKGIRIGNGTPGPITRRLQQMFTDSIGG